MKYFFTDILPLTFFAIVWVGSVAGAAYSFYCILFASI